MMGIVCYMDQAHLKYLQDLASTDKKVGGGVETILRNCSCSYHSNFVSPLLTDKTKLSLIGRSGKLFVLWIQKLHTIDWLIDLIVFDWFDWVIDLS